MGKHLKLNIKNTQLAEALKAKKTPAAPNEAVPSEAEPKKKLTRLRTEESAATIADLDAPKKKRARIISSPDEQAQEKKEEFISEKQPTLESLAPPSALQTSPTPSESELQPEAPNAAADALAKKVLPKRPSLKELRPAKKKETARFDSRDRQGLRDADNEAWRKRRAFKPRKQVQEDILRPKNLTIRLPITIKDLAQEMKLKASQLIAKLFMQGVTLTLNDYLDDDTTVQLLGHEFECNIKIDTAQEERIRITDQSIRQEIGSSSKDFLELRSPVVTFMGHVDHGKTSLIDYVRKSNRAAAEAGAITQHIGAFRVTTNAGNVAILDTPGHEAFSEMRSRGANVTDIVILVIAGDEGIKAQTDEAIKQAREAQVPILVALNKMDKAGFDPQKVYRQLADRDLLPEAWGGTTITVNCSATSGEGIKELLEMIALQAEILELRANPSHRARGTVLESEMHKGLGAVATVLVQNGTLRKGDAIVFGHYSGRIKTMQDDMGMPVEEAGPSTPVKITGLSELAEAGHEFIVVKSEKEARSLAAMRAEGALREKAAKPKLGSLEKMLAKKESGEKKILPLILRADVQGSLEALKASLYKIKSDKARIEIVSADVGEISESDIALAAASKATIVGFHTSIESHADELIKQKKVLIYSHDVIYHIIDEVKERMRALLDKIAEERNTGEILVKAVFRSSQLGLIAGCQVNEGIVKRQQPVRQLRNGEMIWKGKIASLKRGKDDVKEVQKGFECGILLEGQSDIKEGDIFEAYEIHYLEQEL
ncbi:MAG: translation initiation factor IF-2 [Chlamydiae bacterium RIFCSPHIGHO2_12_FULL_44_59]|nr:MAG: translation initiation factor IF-2 [Chlamydiae bacterium RIFCSPHIGHO2_01_FULL_44_39]OGN59394.1 MAG: translation initiation factor IF-2 [Chlamydiae bacterium RIFCSPHIGHO2_02_FULL_45_9]OGN59634.1 MAG: translation initiation factor IF-2 [Chlamydiae bacterium RIFCSPHIGHO2_12_FULL_44_59]OGN65724.1 MAG: translation initiation factor IF-2 [Chlamydiae bacterium RIFCSPLOWO2_01_FULL_44_52]OGN67866.1 MAG: translation initiation factor IF-2 [Chlamydiae bacterium RIFCSPLOWO2_02_FULL_45_22]OGN69357.